MTRDKFALPHLSDDLFFTDGGIETTLIFQDHFELPHFAAFDLLKDQKGYNGLQDYYRRFLKVAKDFEMRFILEAPTWRANPDWIRKLGYSSGEIVDINTKAVSLLVDLKKEFEDGLPQILISGCVGPRGDGYKPESKMSVREAGEYHSEQINVFSRTAVDMITAITMNYVEEAIGIAFAAADVNLPAVISFTVETDGKLPTGMTLKEAVELVDESIKDAPVYYMINCAHPSHFLHQLEKGKNEYWTSRIKGIRANASCKSHAELDEATELDIGKPEELGIEYKRLKNVFDQLNVFGGCCGTDERHILEIVKQISANRPQKQN